MLLLRLLTPLYCGAQQSLPVAVRAATPIEVSSPLDYEVFQRHTKLRGSILVSGHLALRGAEISARLSGPPLRGMISRTWRHLRVDAATGDFSAELAVPAGGFYSLTLTVRSRGRDVATFSVAHVGVGEVFVVAGQSNSTNYGETRQVSETRMVSAFDGRTWRVADDPQPGVQDNSQKGSFVAPFGDDLFRKYGVPIGVASVGHGSTSVRQWLPGGEPVEVMPTMTRFVNTLPDGTLVSDGTLFNGMLSRVSQLGPHGFRAVLWHQGESDAHQPAAHEISGETYRRMLEHIIQESRRRAGWSIPWMVAQATYHSPEDPSCAPIRTAQRSVWTDGVALEGPDTDTLGAAFRQNNGKGVHLNDAGLKAHGALWAQRVELYLDAVLR
jgi:hypothetical protein